jgi:hypothetical protein
MHTWPASQSRSVVHSDTVPPSQYVAQSALQVAAVASVGAHEPSASHSPTQPGYDSQSGQHTSLQHREPAGHSRVEPALEQDAEGSVKQTP